MAAKIVDYEKALSAICSQERGGDVFSDRPLSVWARGYGSEVGEMSDCCDDDCCDCCCC